MKIKVYLILLIIAFIILLGKTFYENKHPVVLQGKKARIIAIASSGPSINSPVSYLFGRSPYFIVCDRLKGTYKSIPNKYLDAQHAAGLRASQNIASLDVDAVCGNNIGAEPSRVFHKANIEVYTNTHGTVLETLKSFPEGLEKVSKPTVPSHFGITQSKKQIPCTSFDAQANVKEIVQGKFFVCFKCNYKISATKVDNNRLTFCPGCNTKLNEIITVTVPKVGKSQIKPKLEVF